MKNYFYMEISQKCIIYPVIQMITDKTTNSVHLGEYNDFQLLTFLYQQMFVKQELFTKEDL